MSALTILAVAPGRRARGHGNALLNASHDGLDRDLAAGDPDEWWRQAHSQTLPAPGFHGSRGLIGMGINDTVPPCVVQAILTGIRHGLGHLFGLGVPPPMISS